MRRIAAPEPDEAKGATDTTWWGFEHRCGGEWRVMGWYGYRDERERMLADGIGSAAQACEVLGGVCRIVETSKTAFKREWKAVA